MSKITEIVEQQEQIVEARRPGDLSELAIGGGIDIDWMARAGELAPTWWSRSRDIYLDKMWRGNNHLSIAVYSAQAKLLSVPSRIVARNPNIDSHVRQASETSTVIQAASEFGRGFNVAMSRFIEDYLAQDNGAFLEVLGYGDPAGPIDGAPLGVRHLDSQSCTRTSSNEFPVVFWDEKTKKKYKIHWTRVIAMSSMTSPRYRMNGVGFCALSRAIDVAQTLKDVVVYRQQQLGSRPKRLILLGKGIKGRQIMQALRMADHDMDNAGTDRYSHTVAIGSQNPDVELDKIDLVTADPFNEESVIQLGMYAIAGAFGLSIAELWPSGSGGTSQADARLQHMRSRGKLVSQFTNELKKQFDLKLIPSYLSWEYDFVDDEEDQQRAIISDIRARARRREEDSGVLTERGARQKMYLSSDLSRNEFVELELASGRLEDGRSIASLFFRDEIEYAKYLRFPFNPLDDIAFEIVQPVVADRLAMLYVDMSVTSSRNKLDRMKQSEAALHWLLDKSQLDVDQDSETDQVPNDRESARNSSTFAVRQMSLFDDGEEE